MAKIFVHSQGAMSPEDLQTIQQIIAGERCPYKQLKATFSRFAGIDKGILHFDRMFPQGHVYELPELRKIVRSRD